ncbi:MAG: formate dehydrogenase accessory sulfurtransferase FdhD [Coraliomargaritaceae bacterium]
MSLPAPQSLPNKTTSRTSIKVVKQRVTGAIASPPEEDHLAIEDPIEIVLHYDDSQTGRTRKTLSLTMRTPGHDVEMITGFLFGEGIIQAASDIESIEFNQPIDCEPSTSAQVHLRPGLQLCADSFERNFAIHSSCGVCGKTSLDTLTLPATLTIQDNTVVDANWIHQLPNQMHQDQEVFQKTGGLHAAALFSSKDQSCIAREDIGRHNALDKVIGAHLRRGLNAANGQVLCVSGRMSYEILQKALVARIPIIAGVGAPSSLAVAVANDFKLTLIGFVRNGSYNMYSCPERIRTQ